MNRAERRRQEREATKRRTAAVIVGDGIVARAAGHVFDGAAVKGAELRPKVPGEHRWIATAAYVLGDADVEHAADADRVKFLDQENLMHLAIGCWDCERPLGDVQVGSRCDAAASD